MFVEGFHDAILLYVLAYVKYSELVTVRRMEGKLSSRLGTEHLKVRIQSTSSQRSAANQVAFSLVLFFSLTTMGPC